MYLRIPDKTKGWDRAKESVVYIILLSCIFWLRCGWWLHRLAALAYDQISTVGGTSYIYRKSPESSPEGPIETWPADGLGSRPGGPSKPPCSDQVACQKSRWSFESPWRQDILQHVLHQNQAQDRLMGRVSVPKKNIEIKWRLICVQKSWPKCATRKANLVMSPAVKFDANFPFLHYCQKSGPWCWGFIPPSGIRFVEKVHVHPASMREFPHG